MRTRREVQGFSDTTRQLRQCLHGFASPPVPLRCGDTMFVQRSETGMSEEKTEEPTQKKLEDAREKGQAAKSQDVSAALVLLSITVLLWVAAEATASRVLAVVTRLFDQLALVDGAYDLNPVIVADTLDALLAVAPFVIVSVLIGIVSQAVQVGLELSFEPISPDFEKVNPGAGLKKLVSLKSVVEFVKTLIKAVALIAVMWAVVRDLLPLLLGSAYLEPAAIAVLGWGAVMRVLGGALLLYLVVGALDFGLQKFLFLREQRMTKDEVKREYKEMEGDPEIKGKRKQLAREYVESAPRQTVPGATVVVTNPTHYAVALRYEPGETPLPLVVAKGTDGEAMEIRRIAESHGVPIIEEPPLARALFTVPLAEPVPEALFEAVAAVLRWVALIKGGGAERRV
jgi:type III secretion protein U